MRGLRGGKISIMTLVTGSHGAEADVCPEALALYLTSKNTN